MSRYGLNGHMKRDKVKWVFTSIAGVLLFLFVIGLSLQVFGEGKVKPSEWFGTEETQPDEKLPEDTDGTEETAGLVLGEYVIS